MRALLLALPWLNLYINHDNNVLKILDSRTELHTYNSCANNKNGERTRGK